MTYSLIIPIYNEARTLSTLLNKLDKLDKLDNKLEIIIVDDGSTDGSKDILNEKNQFKIIKNKFNLGKGYSIVKGVDFASNKNIILIDGDLEVDIDNIPNLINIYERKQIDVLVGVRWENNKTLYSDINYIGNYLINTFFNLLYKSNLNDILCCVKIFNKSLFKSLDIRSRGFSIEVETMSKIVLKNYLIKEVNINYKRRSTEEGKKLKLSDGWVIMWTMIRIKLIGK